MQMYLFDYAIFNVCYINAPAVNAGYKSALEGAFSTANTLAANGPITANVALYKGAGGSNTGCSVATNADELKGKIALIYRSTCDFVVKVKNAQNAGAIGVIMYDSISDENLVRMGGTDNTITIPAVFMNNTDGNALKTLLTSGKTLNVTLKIHYMDGSLDAGVMSHEYTHGISNRLTGGPANTSCLQNAEQMGEGWSDYYALMVTTDWSTAKVTDGTKLRPLGTYVVDETPTQGGIRTYPYTTNIAVDKWIYDSLKTSTDNGEVHLIGEIWTTALWEMTWAIIQQDNLINTNFFKADNPGGNSVALKLVTEGLKLQPCSPGFIDGRNAILKADTLLYNGKYSCSIWKAFAKRGMGVKASQGSSKNVTDQVSDYSVPGGAAVTKHVDKDSAAQEEVLTYTITPTCRCADLSNLKVVDTLPSSVTYVSGGTYNSTSRAVTFSGINLTASQSKNFTVQVKLNKGTYFAPTNLFSDSVKTSTIPAANWQNQTTTNTTWKVSTAMHNSGSYSYFAADSSNITTESLVTKNSYQLDGVSTLSFWHYFDTEDGFDGGVVELSSDNGATWIDLGPYMTENGYNNTIDPTDNNTTLHGRSAFSGAVDQFINTVINLASFTGKKVMIRFTFASDDIQGGKGWYIDDIVLKSRALVYNRVQLFDGGNVLQSIGDTVTAIKNYSLPVTWGAFTVEKQNSTARLAWKTLQELNTAKFVVERSADGTNFFEIGTVQASGNSTFSISYQFTDASPLQGVNYYRLRQVDKDGRYDYSEVRLLTFSGLDGLVSISPNPAKDKISITVTGNKKPLKIYLVNNAGQQLHVYDMNGQFMQLNLPAIAAGVYYVRIEGDGVSSQHKLIIE